MGMLIVIAQRKKLKKNLVFTVPYLGVGYVLLLSRSRSFKDLEEIKGKYKPGVAMATAIDGYLFYMVLSGYGLEATELMESLNKKYRWPW